MGGLKREFFTVFKYGMNVYMKETGCFRHNSVAYKVFLCCTLIKECIIIQDNIYLRLGIIAGMCFSQGGGSFNVLALSAFKFICGVSPSEITLNIEEVFDPTIKNFLEQV